MKQPQPTIGPFLTRAAFFLDGLVRTLLGMSVGELAIALRVAQAAAAPIADEPPPRAPRKVARKAKSVTRRELPRTFNAVSLGISPMPSAAAPKPPPTVAETSRETEDRPEFFDGYKRPQVGTPLAPIHPKTKRARKAPAEAPKPSQKSGRPMSTLSPILDAIRNRGPLSRVELGEFLAIDRDKDPAAAHRLDVALSSAGKRGVIVRVDGRWNIPPASLEVADPPARDRAHQTKPRTRRHRKDEVTTHAAPRAERAHVEPARELDEPITTERVTTAAPASAKPYRVVGMEGEILSEHVIAEDGLRALRDPRANYLERTRDRAPITVPRRALRAAEDVHA